MGVWDEIHARQTHMGRQTVVDADGAPRVDLPAEMMSGDVEIFRGELARILHERTEDTVEYVFGDSVATLADGPDGVDVTFERGAPRRFGLVVGADGLHSRIRRLAFGDESRYLRFLDHYVAGFGIPNHLGLDRTGRLYSEPGRAVCVGNYDGDPERAGALLVFRSEPLAYDRGDVAAQKRILRERFAGMGWETPSVLKALEEADDLYFDAIAQIHVDRLTNGRVALLGDAGYGATMGGMGTGWRSSAPTSWPVNSPWRAATTAPRSPSTRPGSGTSPRAARRSPATRARSSPRPPSAVSAAATACTGCSATA